MSDSLPPELCDEQLEIQFTLEDGGQSLPQYPTNHAAIAAMKERLAYLERQQEALLNNITAGITDGASKAVIDLDLLLVMRLARTREDLASFELQQTALN